MRGMPACRSGACCLTQLPPVQVEAKRKEIAEAEKAAAATQSRLSELRNSEKQCALHLRQAFPWYSQPPDVASPTASTP